MSVLTLLWVGTLCVIYVSSYFEVSNTNVEMLQEYSAQYILDKPMEGLNPIRPLPDKGPHFGTNQFKLSTFYSVALSYDGRIIDIRNDDSDVYTDKELGDAAKRVLAGEESVGVANSLVYYRADKDGYILVSFMDNTIIRESMSTLFRYTLIFGGIALVALFFLAVYLAKRIVKPLEESYQKQKQFISDAGHELKTPVSVVSANAELLSRELGENQWLANIQYENERMGKLVEQLLDLARTENAKLQKELLDFSRLVAGGVLPFESIAFEQGMPLKTRIADDISLMGIGSQLSQLISILVDNAIRHGKTGEEVVVDLSATRSTAVLSVVNGGAPIPEDQVSQLFERFFRVDEARNGEEKHYGLGLAIAKAIVLGHGGTIEVNSFNNKVEFLIKLPRK